MSTALPNPADARDLTACDREPIHVPGSIQAHGHLLIVDPGDGRIVGAAGRADGLTRDLIGQTLSQALGGVLRNAIDDLPRSVPFPWHP